MTATVESAKVGDVCRPEHIPPAEGLTVQPACDQNNGNWHCIPHRASLDNNLQKDIHIGQSGHHVLAWWCSEHGPEVP